MDRRKRREGASRAGAWDTAPVPRRPGPPTESRSAKTAAREEAARSALAPLAPGERPRALLAAVAIAALLGVGNAIAFAAGATIGGKHPGPGVLAFSGLMAILAGGMWWRRYIAVLAFEALLAAIVLAFALLLVEAANVEAIALCLVVMGGAGALFWKLVRVMGRLAAPRQSSG
jgi:hypothetical protein